MKDKSNNISDIYAVRRANLRRMSQDYEELGDFADALDMSKSYLSQLIGRTTHRDVGERLARKIESQLGLRHGALDEQWGKGRRRPRSAVSASESTPIDATSLSQAVSLVRQELEVMDVALTDDKFAEVVTLAYMDIVAGVPLTRDRVRRLLKISI